MGGGESSGAAHGDQGIDGTDAKFGGARTITIVRARKAKEGLSAVMQIFASGVEVGTVFAPSTARRNSNSATSRSAAARPSRNV